MKRNLGFSIAVAVLLPIFLLAAYSFMTIRRELTRSVEARMRSIAELSARSLEERFNRVIDLGTSFATRVQFRKLIAEGKWEEAMQILKRVPADFPFIDRILLTDPEGTLRIDLPPVPTVRGKNFAYRDWYKGVSREWKPYVSEVYRRLAEPQYNVVATAFPIRSDEGKILGILVLQLKLDTLLTWSRQTEVGPGGFVYFVDQKGQLAASPDQPPQANIVDYSMVPSVQRVLRGERGIDIQWNPIARQERLGAYEPVPHYGWGIVAQQPASLAFAARRATLIVVGLVSMIVIGLGALATIIILRLLGIQREANLRQRQIIETSYDAFVTIDPESTIIEWNAQAEATFGWTRSEVLGKKLHETIIPPAYREAHIKGMAHFLKTGEGPVLNRRLELSAIHRNGHEFPIELSIWALPVGRSFLFNAFAHDISERKEAEKKQAELAEELGRSNEELEQFAYVASHDLQEPLRMVASFTQLLGKKYKGKMDADADEYIHFAVDGAQRMQALIHDLLEYSRIETQGKPLVPVETEKILSRVLQNIQLSLEEVGAEITHDSLPTVPGDDLQLVRLFQNLIGNAIKFRGQKPPRIHLTARRQDNEWIFSVRDNGIGIEPQYFDRIFQIFQRLHGRDKYPGTGIGLAACKKIVERHGGRIWVESTSGQGSTFYFTLPGQGTTMGKNQEGDHGNRRG